MFVPTKLMIREDHDANLVRASFARLDGSDSFEVATINAEMLRKTPGLFEKWTAILSEGLAQAIEDIHGVSVERFEEFPGGYVPPETN